MFRSLSFLLCAILLVLATLLQCARASSVPLDALRHNARHASIRRSGITHAPAGLEKKWGSPYNHIRGAEMERMSKLLRRAEDEEGEDCEEEEPEGDLQDCIDTPSNIASGTRTGDDGCTKFHTVVSGDTCYGIIGDSGDLGEFYQNNPSVDNECSNLEIGVAYCASTD